GEGIALIGGAEDGAAEPQHVAARGPPVKLDGLDRPRQQAGRAVADADHGPAERGRAAHDGADDRIEAGAIAAAGEDADALDACHGLLCRSVGAGAVSAIERSSTSPNE